MVWQGREAESRGQRPGHSRATRRPNAPLGLETPDAGSVSLRPCGPDRSSERLERGSTSGLRKRSCSVKRSGGQPAAAGRGPRAVAVPAGPSPPTALRAVAGAGRVGPLPTQEAPPQTWPFPGSPEAAGEFKEPCCGRRCRTHALTRPVTYNVREGAWHVCTCVCFSHVYVGVCICMQVCVQAGYLWMHKFECVRRAHTTHCLGAVGRESSRVQLSLDWGLCRHVEPRGGDGREPPCKGVGLPAGQG